MKFYIETYGCSANFADSERMVSLLLDAGYQMTNEENADVIIVNTCGVKDPTERKIMKRLEGLKNKKVIVTGCLPLIRRDLVKIFPNFSFLSPDKEYRIVEAMNKKIIDLEILEKPRFIKKHFRFNPIIEIVPISLGCTGNCTYCATKFARGRIRSYQVKDIIEQIEFAVKDGAKEIWVTSQDTGAYGVDIEKDLVYLLKKIIEVEGKFYVRIGMMNINHAKRVFNKLIKVYESEKIFKFLHIPVQSGSNKILSLMKREYEANDFVKLVEKFREKFPYSTIATDVIVGFPNESEDDFLKTYNLIKETKPDVVNVSRFSPRPMTAASKMKQINGGIIKDRSRKISSLVRNISKERNSKWLGWEGKIIVDEFGKKGMKGRNIGYKQVIVENGKIGEEYNVKIVDYGQSFLFAKRLGSGRGSQRKTC